MSAGETTVNEGSHGLKSFMSLESSKHFFTTCPGKALLVNQVCISLLTGRFSRSERYPPVNFLVPSSVLPASVMVTLFCCGWPLLLFFSPRAGPFSAQASTVSSPQFLSHVYLLKTYCESCLATITEAAGKEETPGPFPLRIWSLMGRMTNREAIMLLW